MLVWCTMGNCLASCAPSGAGPRWAALLLLVACASSSGCATIGFSNPRFEDTPLQTTKEQVPTPEGHFVAAKQTGTTVSIVAKRACDVRESTTVRRRTRAERVNQSAALDWTFGGLGLGLAASGAVILVDSSKVYPNDASARQYNPMGPTGARILGASLAAAGVALATVAVVDAVRASGEQQTVGTATVPGNVVERGIQCAKYPLAEAIVTLRLSGRDEPLDGGVTGPDGSLTIDLERVVPPGTSFGIRDSVQLVVAGEPAGAATLDGLYAAREGNAWQSLSTDACVKPKSSGACNAVRVFLMQYIEGAHAAEARALLAVATPTIERLKGEEVWRNLDSMGCTGLDDRDADQVATACAAIKGYIDQFPNGQHLGAAAEMVRTGAAVESKRRADADRRAKEQANKDRVEAERAEQKARACVQRKCSAICKVRCPYSQSCLEGCVELCTSSDSLNSQCGVGR